jgi:hypothetical protein
LAAVLACASALCGCGAASGSEPAGPIADLPFARSGQRLKVWSFVGNGVDLFSTFHDNQLDADCEFIPSPAGDRHVCLPKDTADVVYLDAACTRPAARSGPAVTLAPGQWVSGVVPGTEKTCVGGSPPERVGYRVAERLFAGGIGALNQPLPTVFSGTASDCRQTNLQVALLAPDLFRLERQDDSVFVSGTLSARPGTDGLVVERLVAEDAAELTVGVLGRDARPCLIQSDGRCVPGPISAPPGTGAGTYLDAHCTERAFSQVEGDLCDAPKLGVKTVAGQVHVYELEQTSVVFAETELLDPATGARVFDSEGQQRFSCKPETGFAAYAPSKEVTSNFAMTGSTEAAFGAFRLVRHISPVGRGTAPASPIIALEAGGTFVDEQGRGCKTRATARNALECDPDGPEIFAAGVCKDAACESQLYDFVGPHDDPAHIPDISALRDVDLFGGVPRTWLSFKPYRGPTYRATLDGSSPVDSTSLLLEVDRAVVLPDLPLVER